VVVLVFAWLVFGFVFFSFPLHGGWRLAEKKKHKKEQAQEPRRKRNAEGKTSA
jgi:hypothetical protein